MRLSVEFTDVYDGEEFRRVEVIDVPEPAEDVDEWAAEHVRPRTGDGQHTSGESGYFAKITSCVERPNLVGREFEWGV
jgi:hypothetical protein